MESIVSLSNPCLKHSQVNTDSGYAEATGPIDEDYSEVLDRLSLSDTASADRDITEFEALSFHSQRRATRKQTSSHQTHGYPAQISPLSSDCDHDRIADPFQLRAGKSWHEGKNAVLELLNYNNVELSVELVGVERPSFFSSPECFIAMFVEELCPGRWRICDKSEPEVYSGNLRFIRKFSLRAATAVDRAETLKVAVFDKNAETWPLDCTRSLGYQSFCIDELLESEQMMVEKCLQVGRSGHLSDGRITLALEIIRYDDVRKVSIDFGFLGNAPVRNRMFFIISRALRKGKWSPVYRSEVRPKESVGQFAPVTLTAQEFHGGDACRLFRLEVHRSYRNGKTKMLGFMQTSLTKLSSMEANDQLYWWPSQEGITSAKVIVENRDVGAQTLWFSLRLGGLGM